MASSIAELNPIKGRGTLENPAGRFESLHLEIDEDALEEMAHDPDYEPPAVKTQYLRDDSQSLISHNASPDLGFDASINPYRGCEHGCAYCYARPYHEYLGFSAGLDFETRIMVKLNAPELLEAELGHERWKPQTLACSGVTDCYQPVERKLEITRRCLQVLADYRNPVGIVTKNHLVTRDIDHLQQLAVHRASAVMLSVTTLDRKLSAVMEPRASLPEFRLRAIRELSAAGIPCGVSVAPIIPGLNDHEIPSILEAAADHGACYATYTVLRLPHGLPDLFFGWLDRHFPEKRAKVENAIRGLREGELTDTRFGSRMKGEGPLAEQIRALFQVSARRHGLNRNRVSLSTAFFRKRQVQLQLWGGNGVGWAADVKGLEPQPESVARAPGDPRAG